MQEVAASGAGEGQVFAWGVRGLERGRGTDWHVARCGGFRYSACTCACLGCCMLFLGRCGKH